MFEFKYKLLTDTNTIQLPIELKDKEVEVYGYFHQDNSELSDVSKKLYGFNINPIDTPTRYDFINPTNYFIYKNILTFYETLPKDLIIVVRSKE